jgi:hypothetical protein
VTATRHLVSPATIDLSGSDKALFGASFTKLSDAVTGMILEDANADSGAGGYGISAPRVANSYAAFARSTIGGTGASGPFAANRPAPASLALLADADWSRAPGAEIGILINNALPSGLSYALPGDQNTGTFANRAAFIGSRAGVSLPFNGLIHALTIRGGAYTNADRDLFSRYMMQFTPGVAV